MRNFDNESEPERDWEDEWEASSWNEFNWEQYLRGEDGEVAKYKTLYGKLVKSSNRLDEVALFMGWQQGPALEAEAEAEEESDHPQPYTLHKHPLFIASKALHGWLIEKWSQHVSLCSDQVSAEKALQLQTHFTESDYYGLLAVSALYMDDFALAIAYFKRGMVALNKSLALLNEIESVDIEPLPTFVKQARIRLFDIREIWLRVSSDCRETISRGTGSDEE